MRRPLSAVNGSIPKIIHQSWKSEELPDRFVQWSDTWRMHHPDWEWVLWTNEDNRALVELHFPWFKKAYEDLGYEILRADTVRNMYMYIFGG
jgi:mannosyltransferase OCH1-like enzyme